MISALKIFFSKRNGFAVASLFLFCFSASAFLPNGKIQNYSFREQSKNLNYEIIGDIGFVSHMNGIFSAEKAVIKIYSRSDKNLKPLKTIQCDEITYELNSGYIGCIQDSKYLSLDLKKDKFPDLAAR